MQHFRLVFLALAAAALAGCPSNPSVDSGVDAPAADTAPDQSVDTFTPLMSTLFGRCRLDADCPADSTCLLNTQGYPEGFCSRTCTRDSECEVEVPGHAGVCVSVGSRKMCMRECLNGFDCGREGYTCVAVSNRYSVCQPSCVAGGCGAGAQCNLWTSQCEPEGTPAPTGNQNGEPCTTTGEGSECRGQLCIRATDSTGKYTGWNNGACVSSCALPLGYNSSTLFAGDDFPQGNCPTGSICFPNGDGYAERDPGLCLGACRSDSDCRVGDGYYCRRSFQLVRGTRTFGNGYCAPVDCHNDTSHPCPSGYECQRRTSSSGGQTQTYGVCIPAPPAPDAGGTDATAPDAGETDAAAP
jgi:hypothetical protein